MYLFSLSLSLGSCCYVLPCCAGRYCWSAIIGSLILLALVYHKCLFIRRAMYLLFLVYYCCSGYCIVRWALLLLYSQLVIYLVSFVDVWRGRSFFFSLCFHYGSLCIAINVCDCWYDALIWIFILCIFQLSCSSCSIRFWSGVRCLQYN